MHPRTSARARRKTSSSPTRRQALFGAAGLAIGLSERPATAAATPLRSGESETSPQSKITDQLGVVTFDSYDGDTDDDKMSAALSHIGSLTYKPTLVLANRLHSFDNTYPLNIQGLRISGPLGGMAREFRNNIQVHCPSAGLFSVNSSFKDFAIRGLTFTGSGAFIATTKQVLTDCNIDSCGFVGFASVYSGKILRCNFSNWYVNAATDTQLDVGGSDSVLFEGMNFMSGKIRTGAPYMRFGWLSQTKVGKMYCTPTHGYGLLLEGSDSEGLAFYDWTQTAYGQSQGGPTGAGIRITGGQGHTFYGGVIFNMNTDDAGRAEIEVTGGSGHVFNGIQFVGTHNGFTEVNLSSPCIYTTVPIVCRDLQAVGGKPAVLVQSEDGLIRCDDPGWKVITRPR